MRKPITSNQMIPEEIIEEILCNLPVKSLLRFKCVSKRWRFVTSSEHFIKKHLSKSSAGKADNSSKFIFSFGHEKTDFLSPGSCSVHDEHIVRTNSGIQIRPVKEIRILGSCNGLVLLKIIHTCYLILWNPSTRQTKSIIKPVPFLRVCKLSYGFGYDELTNEYKVVCIEDEKPYPTRMYSSKTGSWKEIENLNKPLYKNTGIFVGGRLHWLVYEDCCGWVIVALDLVEEKYETVAWPECFSNIYYYLPKLENMGGYLSFMTFDGLSDGNVWVMAEYGARESWTKIWTFSDFPERPMSGVRSAVPLCLNKNGDIVVAFGLDVVAYNGKESLRASRFEKFDGLIDLVAYVESLVSPFGVESLDSPFVVETEMNNVRRRGRKKQKQSS